MVEPDVDVVVVGAGLAGLAAAGRLHRAGLAVTVCEAGDDVGGRVRTDEVDGFRLDRGFQVLLPAYPEVRRVFDLPALDLRYFLRGAVADSDSGRYHLVPPWRRPSAAASIAVDAARFAVGRPRDVAALGALSVRDLLAPDAVLRRQSPDRSIRAELSHWGVSERSVREVLGPFLAGVFLDPSLGDSARLFHLIWRCFLRGGGAVPDAGMAELPRQLARALPPGSIRTRCAVDRVHDARADLAGVDLADGTAIRARAVVVATDGTTAQRLVPAVPEPVWHGVTTWYFAASPDDGEPVLLLDGSTGLLINTAVISAVAGGRAPAGAALVSASVPGRATADDGTALESRVRTRLGELYRRDTRKWDVVARYAIPRALPSLGPGRPLRRPVRFGPGRYVCGDHRDTGSIQGALVSGRRAADAVRRDLLGHDVGRA
ncbi:NAD(P)/FAD-dependent oxidoreductase [Actinosynnema sp. NPDC023658]|uniref:NAD(P)/FAD-dependent oxidoreductase n=1 Tax=Actinosynnema sp. NPDC023658 TaxID=3155465 RepID=UPI0033C84CB4